MSVLVYPRLSELLEQRNVTVPHLVRQIEERFGLRVSRCTLERLTHTIPIRHADLELAGAVATILGVELSDIFSVEATPLSDEAEVDILDPTQSRRMRELHDLQGQRLLTDEEWTELEGLVSAYGHRLHERRMRELAQQRGTSVEQAERETAAALAEALDWWREVQDDPARLRELIEQAQRHEASATAPRSGPSER